MLFLLDYRDLSIYNISEEMLSDAAMRYGLSVVYSLEPTGGIRWNSIYVQ